MLRIKRLFKIRIVYKNGYAHDFECTEFKISANKVEWNGTPIHNHPLKIGVDDIAAVWQIGARRTLTWEPKKSV